MKRLTSILAVVAFVAIGALFVSAPRNGNSLQYDQVRTDVITTYPHQVSADRSWCVEMVDPSRQDVFGRTMRPTPPQTKVVWINKRTSLSGEGVIIR